MRFLFFALFILIHGCGCVGLAQVPQPNVSKVFEFIDSKDNYVKNPIARMNDKNITCVNATAVQSTSAGNKLKGYASWTIDASALNGYCEFALDAIRDPHGSNNIQMEFMGFIKGDGSLYKAQILDGSSNVKIQTNVFGNNSDWRPFSAGYPGQASPKVRITQTEAGTAPAIQVGVYYGPATNVGSVMNVVEGVSYTPTVTVGSGTVPAYTIYSTYSILGDKIQVTGTINFTSTPAAFSALRISLPSPYTFNFARMSNGSGDLASAGEGYIRNVGVSNYPAKLRVSSAIGNNVFEIEPENILTHTGTAPVTSGAFSNTFPFSIASGSQVTFTSQWMPINGSSSSTAVRVENLDYAPRAFTPTVTGAGTITSVNCTEARQGAFNQIDCKFTFGTSTGVTMTIALPYGRIAASNIPGSSVVGIWIVTPQSGTVDKSILASAGSGLLYPTYNVATIDQFTPQVGTAINSSGAVFAFTARVPIQGWDSNANGTMVIPNSVTSNYIGLSKLDSASLRCFSTSSILSNPAGIVSSIGNISSGVCAVNFAAGKYQNAPRCWVERTTDIVSNALAGISTVATTSGVSVRGWVASTNTNASDFNFDLFCLEQ